MYSTSRVVVLRAGHERHGRDDRPVAVGAHDLLGAEPVRASSSASRPGSAPRATRGRRFEAVGLRRDDPEVERLELVRVGAPRSRSRGGRCGRVTRRPSRFRASACSRRRVRTETSATCARCPAKRLPITPAPITQTRWITRRPPAGARRRTRGITAAREELLVLDRHPVRSAARVDGDPDLGDARADRRVSSIRSTMSSGVPDPDVVLLDELLEGDLGERLHDPGRRRSRSRP